MNKGWSECRKILCIRPDNMGDLIMSSPAIRALKNTFNCHITVLTSSMANGIAGFISCIDDTICYDLPWVKNANDFDITAFNNLIEEIRSRQFDAAVVFTVYSQNPLPSAMIAFLAGIPKRLAYCRENPYGLLTDWVPEKEPYTFIRHQVQRDLDLVGNVGAFTKETDLALNIDESKLETLKIKLGTAGVAINKPWVIFHAGVSELKRQVKDKYWKVIGKNIMDELDHQVLFTGSASDTPMVARLVSATGKGSFNLAGLLSLEEFIMLLKISPLIISVNTGTIHIAAAVNTPVIVMYALTNPQHTPWKSTGKIFPFAVPSHLKSRNEVIRFVDKFIDQDKPAAINTFEIINAVRGILSGVGDNNAFIIPELVHFPIHNQEVL